MPCHGNLHNGAVGELGWSNPYAYVNGNPINLVDPSGMVAENPYDWSGCYDSKATCADGHSPVLGLCCSLYNSSAAKAYALAYAGNPNVPLYKDYDHDKSDGLGVSDCANFVSQALLAGGFLMGYPGGSSALSKNNQTVNSSIGEKNWACAMQSGTCIGTKTWRGAPALSNFLSPLGGHTPLIMKRDDYRVSLQNPEGQPDYEKRIKDLGNQGAQIHNNGFGVGDVIYLDSHPEHIVMIVGWGPAVYSWQDWTGSNYVPSDSYQSGYVPYIVDHGSFGIQHQPDIPRPYYLLGMIPPSYGNAAQLNHTEWKFIAIPPIRCVKTTDVVAN